MSEIDGAKYFLGFSKVALDGSMNKAVVYMEYYCGPRCGAGVLYQVEKTKDGWTRVRELGTVFES